MKQTKPAAKRVTIHLNPSWPPGSNARLLLTQRRSAFGYTQAEPTIDGPKLRALSGKGTSS
jgi:hypothetical protein